MAQMSGWNNSSYRKHWANPLLKRNTAFIGVGAEISQIFLFTRSRPFRSTRQANANFNGPREANGRILGRQIPVPLRSGPRNYVFAKCKWRKLGGEHKHR